MKKITSLLALLGIITSLSLTACSSDTGTTDPTGAPPADTPTEQPETPPADNP